MPSNNERQSKSLMQLGAGLAIFGLVCPVFWLSLFSRNSSFEIWVYAMHSGFFVAIGLALLGKGWYDLKRSWINTEIVNPDEIS